MRITYWLIAVGIVATALLCGSWIYDTPLPFTNASEPSTQPAAGKPKPISKEESARLFDSQIAPLLARHCLECHGEKVKKGRLDLSRKQSALAGGRSGKVIVPSQAGKSLLWEHIESGDMPPKGRTPLTPNEKQLVRQWIDAGAVWSGDAVVSLAFTDERLEPHKEFAWTGNARDPGPILLRRLTVSEYIETVRSAVGVDMEAEARKLLPPDVRADGFSNTAYNLNIDLAHVEVHAQLAQMIVARMDVKKFAARFSKNQKLSDDNMRQVIAGMGKWLLRGPLAEHEIRSFLKVSTAVAKSGGDFTEAVSYVLEAMLQSPRFLYRIENTLGDGTPRQVNGHELAARLSYILWGGPPDQELMRAADAGELADSKRVKAQVERMLKDPRAIEKSSQFIAEWLNLDQLSHLQPNKKQFPQWNSQLAADMREETLAYFKYVVWEQKRPLPDLLNTQFTFATPRLAEFYGLKPEYRIAGAGGVKPANVPKRVAGGLSVLYTFEEKSGDVVRDVSQAGEPLHLKIATPAAVRWSDEGLTITGSTLIATAAAPKRLIDAVKKSRAITLEAWITPADTKQAGPARILTLSSGSSLRNFTLGQDGNKYDVRFRTTARDKNGLPSMASPGGAVKTQRTHVVFTRGETGTGLLYINGEEKAGRDVAGTLANWDNNFRLLLANESTNDRPWKGTLHLIALYSRALTPDEVRQNFAAGARQDQSLARYDLSKVPGRGGMLTQGSVLTVGGDEASMVARGLFVLHDLLCSKVGDPPPCVDTTPIPTKPGLSNRGAALVRLSNASCVGCHAKFEPLAFGLEKFDGIGAYHEKDEHGNKLRDDGEILFPGQTKPVAYKSSAELMDLLAKSERIRQSFTLKLTQFALGRPLVKTDARLLDEIHKSAQADGFTYPSLITAIVMSDLVRMTRTEKK